MMRRASSLLVVGLVLALGCSSPERGFDDVVASLRECPAGDEPWREAIDLAAAEDRYAALTERFGDAVGLVHGRMKPTERDRVMAGFVDGSFSVLVATTVIEVGVDVPEATVMVVEHAERFGLAQLHQLRGRVGRSERPSVCLLLYKRPLGSVSRMMATEETGVLK